MKLALRLPANRYEARSNKSARFVDSTFLKSANAGLAKAPFEGLSRNRLGVCDPNFLHIVCMPAMVYGECLRTVAASAYIFLGIRETRLP
jgi:hypothetical protein